MLHCFRVCKEKLTMEEKLPMETSTYSFDLVANCAHDLKTPLAAIFSSNQLTISILSDIQAVIEEMNPAPAGLLNDIMVAKSTLQAALNMTEFMKMSINRCMDFAKVQNHAMKLNPKCETVDIAEAMQLPLHCMMTVDSDQIIQLKPLPEEMCSHVITDLQWLQENVLCLSSNAAKYSSGGTITLSVSLCSESSLTCHSVDAMTATEDLCDQDAAHGHCNWQETSPLGRSHSSCFEDGAGSPRDRTMVVVECEDTGIGLSDEAMANLFAPFKQAQRLAGGTGLGLFSLANRMEALQGRCGVRGRRDGAQGSLFWFAFPYKPDEEAAEVAQEQDLTAEPLAQPVSVPTCCDEESIFPFNKNLMVNTLISLSYSGDEFSPSHRNNTVTPRAARHIRARSPPAPTILVPRNCSPASVGESGSQKAASTGGDSPPVSSLSPSWASPSSSGCEHTQHILLVDDTPSILKICSRTLVREGFKVTTAENGYEALKLLNQTMFDAVLMDLHMPVMDGLETVRRYRAAEALSEGGRRQFIVAVSASADPSIARGVMGVGFDGYIEKPFSIKVLHAILPFDFGIAARTREL